MKQAPACVTGKKEPKSEEPEDDEEANEGCRRLRQKKLERRQGQKNASQQIDDGWRSEIEEEGLLGTIS
jgi:hypothetical protein